jgi:tripeptidyl-peptidase-1
MRPAVVLLCALVACATARVFTVFESLDHVPKGWTHVGDRSDEIVHFTVALNQRNLKELEEELMIVSNPKHERYGQWWSGEKIRNFVAPLEKEQRAVQAWLEDNDMKVQPFGAFMKVAGSIHAVEKMLSTTFYKFRHTSGKEINRLIEYTVPHRLDGFVQMISGLSGFPVYRKGPRVVTDDTKGKIVPEVIWDLYQIPSPQEIVFQNSSLCLVEYENDRSYTASDLSSFESQTLVPSITPNHIVGPYYAKYPDTEATLDVQYGIGVALKGDIWYWTSTGWLYDWATDFLATDPVPYVVSMSWGWDETGQCDVGSCNGMTSYQYVNTVNNQYMQITMRGTTILAASGDQGAPGDADAKCQNASNPLSSIFPGASPWVLSVGATTLTDPDPNDPYPFKSPICQTTDCSTSKTEIVCSYPDALITTGGGFSTFLPRPSYQNDVVSSYLKTAQLPPKSDYNASNRGFPDVSGLGHNYLITYFGSNLLVDGTSASTPVWGAIIKRWNDYRLSNKKSPIGFANPMIYQMWRDQPSAFNDITTGNNGCTESCCIEGFYCSTGWDAVTGLGTPVYPTMWNYITQLP